MHFSVPSRTTLTCSCLGRSVAPVPGIQISKESVWNVRVEALPQATSPPELPQFQLHPRKPAKWRPLPRDAQDHFHGVFKLPPESKHVVFQSSFLSPLGGYGKPSRTVVFTKPGLFLIEFDLVRFELLCFRRVQSECELGCRNFSVPLRISLIGSFVGSCESQRELTQELVLSYSDLPDLPIFFSLS